MNSAWEHFSFSIGDKCLTVPKCAKSRRKSSRESYQRLTLIVKSNTTTKSQRQLINVGKKTVPVVCGVKSPQMFKSKVQTF